MLACGFSGCDRKQEVVERSLGLKAFIPQYNRYIKDWLATEKAGFEKIIKESEQELAAATEKEKAGIEDQIDEAQRAASRIEYRQALGDYFAVKQESDLPAGLVWEDGIDEPEIGDPRATKGGVFNFYMLQFPPTVRPFGKESNNSFRGRLYDELDVSLVGMHPLTNKVIPGVARKWAVS